jgi:hypothetical protein
VRRPLTPRQRRYVDLLAVGAFVLLSAASAALAVVLAVSAAGRMARGY